MGMHRLWQNNDGNGGGRGTYQLQIRRPVVCVRGRVLAAVLLAAVLFVVVQEQEMPKKQWKGQRNGPHETSRRVEQCGQGLKVAAFQFRLQKKTAWNDPH